MPAITPSLKLLSGALSLELLIWPAVCSCNAICIPCTLPRWISVFDTTNKAFHFDGILPESSRTGWSLCFLLVRQSCLLGLWVELGDRLRQTKVFCLAGSACTRCHFPFLKVIKCTACNVRWSWIWEGKIITLQNYHFHAWFPGDTIQLHWQAVLSDATGAWFKLNGESALISTNLIVTLLHCVWWSHKTKPMR